MFQSSDVTEIFATSRAAWVDPSAVASKCPYWSHNKLEMIDRSTCESMAFRPSTMWSARFCRRWEIPIKNTQKLLFGCTRCHGWNQKSNIWLELLMIEVTLARYPLGNDHISHQKSCLSRWFSELPKVVYEPCCKLSCIVSWFEVTFKKGFEGLSWKTIGDALKNDTPKTYM